MKIIIELNNKISKFVGLGMFALGTIFLILSLITSATIGNISIVPSAILIVFAAVFLIGGIILLAISTKKTQ